MPDEKRGMREGGVTGVLPGISRERPVCKPHSAGRIAGALLLNTHAPERPCWRLNMEAETFVDLEKWPVGTETDGKLNLDEEMVDLPLVFEKGLSDVASKVLEHLRNLENTTLNIAITGEPECGKSTFIRSFMGLEVKEDSCTNTSVQDMMTEPFPCPFPKYPKLILWELPRLANIDFQPAAYLQQVNFSMYDAFIIMASEAFTDSHIKLSCEIEMAGKSVFLVHSKVDFTMDAKLHQSTFDESRRLQEIKENCITCSEEDVVKKPHVYRLSCSDLCRYDFELLAEDLRNSIPHHKQHLFLLSLPNVSSNILERKREALKKQIWKFATVSCAIAALPIPGLSVVCDTAILMKSLDGYCKTFSIDRPSLEQLAAKAHTSVVDLRAVIKSPLAQELSTDLVISLLAKSTGAGRMIAETILRNIPVFGSLAAGAISFSTTYCMLKNSLNEIAEDAHRVLSETAKKGKFRTAITGC